MRVLRALLAFLILGAASSASGSIVWLRNQEIAIPTTFDGVSVDLERHGSPMALTSTARDGLVGGDVNFVLGGRGITNDADRTATVPTWQPLRIGTSNTDPIRNLLFGDTVDGTSTSFAAGFGGSEAHFPPFTSGSPGYLGFSLVLDNNDTVFGWMRLTLRDDDTAGAFIHEWAYEDSGGAISVGAIPEPGSAMLALVALGALVLRRRR